MDIYTALARIIAECLTIGNGLLSHLVNMPANATGPLDNNITLTTTGFDFVQDVGGAATRAASILSTMFAGLF